MLGRGVGLVPVSQATSAAVHGALSACDPAPGPPPTLLDTHAVRHPRCEHASSKGRLQAVAARLRASIPQRMGVMQMPEVITRPAAVRRHLHT